MRHRWPAPPRAGHRQRPSPGAFRKGTPFMSALQHDTLDIDLAVIRYGNAGKTLAP